MWIEKEITIEGKKVNAQINRSDDSIEIETQFDPKLAKATSITIDSKNYKIKSITDIGDRQENLHITIEVNNESGSNKGREGTKLSK